MKYLCDFLKKTDVKVYLSLFVYATAILFVISPDSYTHDLNGHVDSAWFFMCGKAWMNGMVPYVDFADSKGILLWLIYGVGYLISHYNYIGVFWLSCLCYSITLFICYKIGYLLTLSKRIGFIVAILMAFPYFCRLFHYEIRAEDWCQPFIAASLFCLLKESLHPSRKTTRMMGAVFGLTFIATLLIKWSIAAMSLGFVASGFFIVVKRRQLVADYILCFIAVAAAAFMPFAVYMMKTDSFGAFLREYFINTSLTVSNGGVIDFIRRYKHDIEKLFLEHGRYVYVIYLAGAFVYYRRHRDITIYPFLCGVFFLALSIKNDYGYYINAVSTFAIFIVVLIAKEISKRYTLNTKTISVIFVASMFLNFVNMTRGLRGEEGYMFFQHNGRKELYNAAYLMSQIKNPKLLNSYYEIGIGISANTLPATLYWSRQNGATKAMDESRRKAVAQRKPDFIMVSPTDSVLKQCAITAGYEYYLSISEYEHKGDIYGRKGLKLPPKDFNVSTIDILLKRKIKLADED